MLLQDQFFRGFTSLCCVGITRWEVGHRWWKRQVSPETVLPRPDLLKVCALYVLVSIWLTLHRGALATPGLVSMMAR